MITYLQLSDYSISLILNFISLR